MSYDKDHVVFDELGLKSVHCIDCNQVIRKRVAVPLPKNPKVAVLTMMTLSNYREREVELSDGSVMYPHFCVDCMNKPLDAEKTMTVLINGWKKELIQAGRPQVAIDRMKRDKAAVEIVQINLTLTESERVGKAKALEDEALAAAEAVLAKEV